MTNRFVYFEKNNKVCSLIRFLYGAFSVALKVLFVLPKLFLFYYVECSDLIMSFAKERFSAVKPSKTDFTSLFYIMV